MAYEDPESMLREFEARIDDQIHQADQLRGAMESVRATHESRDGSVAVTVDSSGGLADLVLSATALRRSPADLSAEILQCSRAAQAKLAQQMSQAVNQVLGAGSETAAFVSNTFAERFPTPQDPADDPDRYHDPHYGNDVWRRGR